MLRPNATEAVPRLMHEELSHTSRRTAHRPQRMRGLFSLLPSPFLPFLKLSYSECPSSAGLLVICQRCSAASNPISNRPCMTDKHLTHSYGEDIILDELLKGISGKVQDVASLFLLKTSPVTLFRRLVSCGFQKPTNADIAPSHSVQWSSLRANTVPF